MPRASSSAAFVALLLLAAGTAAAQEPEAASSDFFEQKETYFRSETVEGVSKHAETPGETPATVTVVSREDIERYGFRTVADVLNFASLGNFVHGDRRYDFAGGRGLFFHEDFNTRILVMLDGHPLNEPWNNFGGVGREMLVPLALAERVEIVYGPSSLLYGGYSLYGIVNVVTKSGASAPGAELHVSGGSWKTGEVVASYGRTGTLGGGDEDDPGRDWSLLVAGGYLYSEGEDLDLPRVMPEFGGPQQGTDFERSPFAFVHGKLGELSLLFRTGARKHGAPLAPYGTIYGSADEYVKDTKTFAEVRWDHALAPGLDLSIRGFYDWYRYFEQDPNADSEAYPGAAGYDFVLTTPDEDRGAEARLTWRRGAHYLTVGGELRHRTVTQTSYRQPFGGAIDPASRIDAPISGHLAVAYLQEEWRPSDRFTFVVGGNFADTDPGGSKAQPRLTAIWKPVPNVSVKGLFGRGFRPPSIFEALYGDSLVQIANPALESEEITSTELSLLWNASDALAVQGYVFHSRLTGLIQGVTLEDPGQLQGPVPAGLAPDAVVGLLQYQSRGEVPSSGGGASLRFRDGGTRAHLNVAYARSRLEPLAGAEETLPGSPAWLVSFGASQEIGDWTGALSGRYVGPQALRAGETGEAGDFLELNVRVRYRFRLVYPVTVSVDLRNALDTGGELSASPIYRPTRVPIEGRRLLVGADVRF